MELAAARSSVLSSPESSSSHQLLALRLLVVCLHHASADNRPADGLGAVLQLHLGAFHLIQKQRQRCLAVDLERKIGQLLLQRFAGIVAQAGNFAAVLTGDGERLQHIVHVRSLEIQPRGFAGPQRAAALKIADSALVKNHFADGNVGGPSFEQKSR